VTRGIAFFEKKNSGLSKVELVTLLERHPSDSVTLVMVLSAQRDCPLG
jgi:hypothetical protein